jgi:Flp pilus assembly protein TadG
MMALLLFWRSRLVAVPLRALAALLRTFATSGRSRHRQRPLEQGTSVVETAMLMPLLLLLLIGAVDYGRGFYAAIEVSSAAEAGALYGTLNYTDTAGMIAMAKLDAKDISGLTATAIYGCECSDGSASSANCAMALSCGANVVAYVDVATSATYVPILRYPGLPTSFALKGKMRLRTAQ